MNTLSNITTNSRHRRGRLAIRTLAAGLLLATAMAAEVHASPTVGTAPIYSGPAPTYGGDPVIGETPGVIPRPHRRPDAEHLADIRFHPGLRWRLGTW